MKIYEQQRTSTYSDTDKKLRNRPYFKQNLYVLCLFLFFYTLMTGQSIDCKENAGATEMSPSDWAAMRDVSQYGTQTAYDETRRGRVVPGYPKGHKDRKDNKSDAAYIKGLFENAQTVELYPGEYQVSELILEKNKVLLGKRMGNDKVIFTGRTNWSPTSWTSTGDKKLWFTKHRMDNPELKNAFNENVQVIRCASGGTKCLRKRNLFLNGQMLFNAKYKDSIGRRSQYREWFYDKDTERIYVERIDEETSLPLRGFSISTVDYGIQDGGIGQIPENVVIENIVFEGYAERAMTAGNMWTVRYCEFTNIHGVALFVLGSKTKIIRNRVLYNSNQGINVSKDDNVDSVTVRHNEMAYTNFFGQFASNWQTAGLKASRNTNLKVTNNYVHHNTSTGLWSDVFDQGTLYEKNLIEENFQGIHYEISSGGMIRQNMIRNHPKGRGIRISGSQNTDVLNNTIYNAQTGIEANQNDRGFLGKKCETGSLTESCDDNQRLKDVTIKNNKVTVIGEFDRPAGIVLSVREESNVENSKLEPILTNPEFKIEFDKNYYQYSGRFSSKDATQWTDFDKVTRFKAGFENRTTLTFADWKAGNGEKETRIIPQDKNTCIEEYYNTTALEAECAGFEFGWKNQTETKASNGRMMVATRNEITSSPNSPQKALEFKFRTDQDVFTFIYARVWCKNTNDNSVFYRLDNNPWRIVNVPPNANGFQWIRLKGDEERKVRFPLGNHTVRFAHRKKDFRIDKIWITNSNQPPSGVEKKGSNCKGSKSDTGQQVTENPTDNSFFVVYHRPEKHLRIINRSGLAVREFRLVTLSGQTIRTFRPQHGLSGEEHLVSTEGLSAGLYILVPDTKALPATKVLVRK